MAYSSQRLQDIQAPKKHLVFNRHFPGCYISYFSSGVRVRRESVGWTPSCPASSIAQLVFLLFCYRGTFVPLGIASYSIVGEKVEKSLEPLLATPLTDGEILLGKTISAVLPTLVAMYAGACVFMAGIDAVTFPKLGYYYFPNWTIGTLLLILVPVAVVLSVLFSVIVSSRVNDVRSASSFGILMFFPFLAIYLASEIGVISLDINNLLIISGILLAVDVALFFVSTATFRREEILTKWK